MERNWIQLTGKGFTTMLGTFFRHHLLSGGRVIIILIATIAGFGVAPPAFGQSAHSEIEVFDIVQQDLNQDGRPDLTIIECAFITEHDRVLVYDRGEDMEMSETWQEATDFENDFWIFDAGADDQIELIISFERTEEGLVARLFDDQDGNGTVQFRPYPFLTVRERGPSVAVVAPDGWWLRDGKINFNLDLRVDGQIQASFSAKPWLPSVKTDGTPEFLIQVRDTDEDGRPDFQWVNARPRARSTDAVRRTEITFNPNDNEPPIKGGIFWPFLGSSLDREDLREDRPARLPADRLDIKQERSGYTKFYGISMPPIQMSWEKGLLLYVGEFVASRFNDDNWFVYSIERVLPGDPVPVNFEAPFAFYDLAADNDGYPELAIRFEQYLKRDLFPFRERNPEPVQIIRYSWDQDNNRGWDYKLGLIGRHAISETVTVGELSLLMIPPAILPEWVTGRVWDGATLVTAEGGEHWTSEGIYEWDIYGYWRDEYVTGISTVRPSLSNLDELTVGQRGEHAFDLHRQPSLYLSPVDGKLHLLGAEGGMWKVDETREIHYANLGGDYLNQWTLVENGRSRKRIYFISNYLIYQDQKGLQLTRTDQAPALFITSPPTDNDERLALERQLQSHQGNFSSWDFEALAAQFGSPHARIEGARIKDLRVTDLGFRFVLELQPGFRATGSDLDLDAITPGAYLVTYDGAFDVKPLTSPDLALSVRIPATDNLLLGVPASILAEVTNRGLADARNLSLVVQARSGDVSLEIIRQRIDALSGVPTRLRLNWKPPTEGKWDLEAWLRYPDGRSIARDVVPSVEVKSEDVAPGRVLYLSAGGNWQLLPLAIMLLVFSTGTVTLLRLIISTTDKRSVNDDARRMEYLTRHLLRLRHKTTRFLGKYSSLFFPLIELRKCLGYKRGMPTVTVDTELVIEGFFRSANTFAALAFQSAQARKVMVANHTHVPATIIRAARWNIPTLVLIREPREAVLSYMLKHPYVSAADGFKEYIAYYTAILPYRNHYVVALFEEVTTDLGLVIDRVNRRFKTNFELFRHTPENVEPIFARIEQEDRGLVGDDVSRFSVPKAVKEQIKDNYRKMVEAKELRPLVRQAEQVYWETAGLSRQRSDPGSEAHR